MSCPARMTMYYQGGCYLVPDEGNTLTILGTYNATGEAAIAVCEYGQGRVFISGPHPEVEEDDDRDGIQFYEPEDGPWDPESDWPLLSAAIKWLGKIDTTPLTPLDSPYLDLVVFISLVIIEEIMSLR